MQNFTYGTELCHYGVKGQKWGRRRYQNPDGSLTPAGYEHYGYGKKREGKAQVYGGSIINLLNKNMYGYNPSNTETSTSEQHKKWYDKPLATLSKLGDSYYLAKNTIRLFADLSVGNIPGAISDAAVMGIAAYNLGTAAVGSVKEKQYFKDREGKKVDKKTGLIKKDSNMTEKEDLSKINPGYKKYDAGNHNNCMLCTTAYDLRRRGYDVTSNKASYGYTNGDIKRWYPKAKINNVSAQDENGKYSKKALINNTVSTLSSQKNARGNLTVSWEKGGGHSMVYEVKDGQVRILDGQTNKVYENPEKILGKVRQVSYTRLDNVEPDYKAIKEAVR